MIPIALCSVVVVALGVGRFLAIRRERSELTRFLSEWGDAPASTDPSRYKAACNSGPDAVRGMAAIYGTDPPARAEASERVESAARSSLFGLETGLGTLATLAAATPLMGFLGTVTGMIRAFMQIQNLGGNVNANVLAGGIWEALVTTATGLAVGIIALIIYNYLTGLVRGVARQIELCADITLRILAAPDEG